MDDVVGRGREAHVAVALELARAASTRPPGIYGLVVAFDRPEPTFRHDRVETYKANREEMPEELRPQIPLTRRATEAFNIACKAG